jgi:predicted nuclease with TOPRIM domain
VRTQFKDGMERLVKNTAEDSGVWQVVVCASAAHSRRLNEMEKLRGENEELKNKMNEEFGGKEGLRKRAREETKEAEKDGTDFWGGFEDHFKTKGFDTAL